MFKEIQRLAVLSIFFYVYIQAQDVKTVKANIKVKEPFAKPDVNPFAKPAVDPFASIKTSGSSNTAKSESKTSTVSMKTPVVGAGKVDTSKTDKNSRRTLSKSPSTVTRKDTITSKSGSNGPVVQSQNRIRKPEAGSSRVAGRRTDTRQTRPATTTQRRENRKSQTVTSGKTATRGTQRVANAVNVMEVDRSRGPADNRRLRNRQSVSDSRSESTNVVRKTRIQPSANKAFKTANTKNELSRDRKMALEANFLKPRANTVQSNIEAVVDEPILYIRKPYKNPRICDNCIGDCYLGHPEHCHKYIRCSASSPGAAMEALEMDCAFGTFWSDIANTCDTASDVVCKNDRCSKDPTLKAYASDVNCRSYWRCVNGRSDSECCPHGEAFVNGVCLPSDSCKVDDLECPYKFRKQDSDLSLAEEEMLAKEKAHMNACTLSAVPGDITAYTFKNNQFYWGEPMRCATGTRFDQKQCTCVAHVFDRVKCKPIADIDFNGTEPKNKEESYVGGSNVTIRKHRDAQSGYGLFNGKASIAVPFFENNQNIGTHFVIQIRFNHDGTLGQDSQVLASNCKTNSKRELSPSFAILLSKSKKEIIFFASTKTQSRKRYGATKSLSIPYKPKHWTVVELRFLDEVLYASVETFFTNGQTEVERKKEDLKGKLTTSVMPLMVGNCNMNDGFVGYIDMVKMYTCNPDLSK